MELLTFSASAIALTPVMSLFASALYPRLLLERSIDVIDEVLDFSASATATAPSLLMSLLEMSMEFIELLTFSASARYFAPSARRELFAMLKGKMHM